MIQSAEDAENLVVPRLKLPQVKIEILRHGVFPAKSPAFWGVKSPTEGRGEQRRRDTQSDIGHDPLIIKFWIAMLSVEDYPPLDSEKARSGVNLGDAIDIFYSAPASIQVGQRL